MKTDAPISLQALRHELLLQLWMLCHEQSYLARREYLVLLEDGRLVRVQRVPNGLARETLLGPLSWQVHSLPNASEYLEQDTDCGGIVVDHAVANRLRDITTKFHEELA